MVTIITLFAQIIIGDDGGPLGSLADLLLALLTAIGIAVVYLLPSLIAFQRHHLNKVPITIVNIFLGWTVVGWVGTLAWSATANIRKISHSMTTPKRLDIHT